MAKRNSGERRTGVVGRKEFATRSPIHVRSERPPDTAPLCQYQTFSLARLLDKIIIVVKTEKTTMVKRWKK